MGEGKIKLLNFVFRTLALSVRIIGGVFDTTLPTNTLTQG